MGSRIFIFTGLLLLLALGLMMAPDKSPEILFKEDYKAIITAKNYIYGSGRLLRVVA
ncbi:hypothetical protein [Chryseobacterium gallinarum]|uniref:Uncharacterized protein n=1 Tax=Chryseobacterium gallinarum TaxID=1324352 RepID=A0ABX6KQH7_CHRGL|nr:hypothetical protein [Chryseobacterium gallinarum]QIY90702.1 hypothetical protein FOB44_08480 [Chryseobacterium gallinarum]